MTDKTEGERLERIETLLESLPEIRADIHAIRRDLDDHKTDYISVKSKGIGLLIGVGLVGGSVGAGLTEAVMSWLT